MSEVTYRAFSGSAAENYERHFLPAIGIPVSAGLLATADLRPGERVLDVGCGTGLIARCAAEAVGSGGSVTGVDIAPEMLELAASRPDPGGAPIDWRHGDATALPFDDGQFDVVLSQLALMFVEDRAAAVREIHRVLVPGGRVVISTAGPIQPTFELMEQAIVDHISSDLAGFVRMVFSMHDPADHVALLVDAGFDAVDSRLSTATLDLPSPAEFLWQYIHLTPMGPFVASAPETAQRAMEDQMVDAWQPYVRDGRTPVDQPMVLTTGVRP